MRLLFINNFCTHFTAPAFEELARLVPTRFVFFSDGGEKYWETANQLHTGAFDFRYLPGFYFGKKLRVTPGLVSEVVGKRPDVVVMALAGRFALPMTYFLTRLIRRPFILWSGMWYHPKSFFHRLSWPLMLWIYRHSDAIITYGSHVKDYLVKHGVDPSRIFIYWHSVDTARMGREPQEAKVQEWRKRLSPEGEKLILYVGRLDEVKSLDTLIEAYSRLRRAGESCQLAIVGRGPEKEALRALAARLEVPVEFCDYVPNPELPEVYAAADVFVLPSKTLPTVKEAWGLVLNEAMLQGCIPVASNAVGAAVGGLFDRHLEDLIFPECQAVALEQVLLKALERSARPEEKTYVRNRALKFSPRNQVEGLLQALDYLKTQGKVSSPTPAVL